MRIVAGKFKGRPLATPSGRATRPTSDRARESIFNILAHAAWTPPLEDARVLDVFAGSGALGLEALSRGASFCLFVETENKACAAIRDNIETLGASDATRLYRRSALRIGARAGISEAPFTLAFLDPPYHKELVKPTLKALLDGDWLADDAVIMVETAAEESPEMSDWTLLDSRTSGAAKLHFLKRGGG